MQEEITFDRRLETKLYPGFFNFKASIRRNLIFCIRLIIYLVKFDKLNLKFLLLYSSPFAIRNLFWKIYVDRDPRYKNRPLSEKYQRLLENLERDGIASLDGEFPEFADYVDKTYFNPENYLAPKDPKRQRGLLISKSLDLMDDKILEFLTNKDLCHLLGNYFGRQIYWRSEPQISYMNRDENTQPQMVANRFHTDGYRQFNVCVLLSDVEKDGTCLEYAKGSHRFKRVTETREYMDLDELKKNFEIVQGTGKKGTLVLFNAGTGIHRGRYVESSSRKSFDVILTTGWLEHFERKYPIRSKLHGKDPFIQEMLKHGTE